MTERRGTSTAARLTLALLLCSCAGVSQQAHEGKDITFGGTLQSSPVQLLAVSSGHEELAALLREEGRIMMLDPAGARDLKAPVGCTSPVVLGLGETSPGESILLVLDSGCGGWIAARESGGDWSARVWADFFPDLVPADQILFEDLDGDGDHDLASATSAWVAGFVREAQAEWRPFEQGIEQPLANRAMISSIGVSAAWKEERVLLMQKPGQLTLLSIGADAPARMLPQTELELLKPFDGFDQLTALPAVENCDLAAVGAGFFSEVYRAPKPLVALSPGEDGFVARRLPTAHGHVVALASTAGPLGQYLGLIEGGPSGFYFEVLERIGCGEFASRVVEPIELAIDGMVPVPDSPEELAATSGESLLGTEVNGALLYSHFDGKNLRRFQVDVSSGWSFHETAKHY